MSGGFSKKVSDPAQKLMYDIAQRYQYAYPEKSTIREIASNGLDSLMEKTIARAILVNNEPVSKYFVEATDELQADSKWNPNYYQLDRLSKKDEVRITYVDGGELGKDSITIEDTGVGMSPRRLEGMLSLG